MAAPLALIWCAKIAAAAQIEPTIDLGPGGTWTVAVAPGEGLVVAPAGGGEPVRLDVPDFPRDISIESVSVIDGPAGKRVARMSMRAPSGRTYEALIHAPGRRPAPALLWFGAMGLAGDFGERVGSEIRIADMDGDGHNDILVGRLAERVTVCGGEPEMLHRRAYDWAGGVLRPVSGPRPGIDAARAIEVRPSAGPPPEALLVPLLEYVAASSSHGDGGDPMRSAPPRGLEDMDERTGWAEGVGGPGRLEFATADVASAHAAARWIAVRPTDGSAGDAVRMRNRPGRIVLVDGEGRSWRLDLPDDARVRAGGVVWFELPEPVGGGCLTAALADTFAARSADGRRADVTWISDLQAFAAVAPEDERSVAIALLDDGTSSLAAERFLRALGDRGVLVVADLVGSVGRTGSARIAAFLASRPEPAAADALIAMLLSEDEMTARFAREALLRKGEAATDALLGLLSREEPGAARLGLELLGRTGGLPALGVLISRAGGGDTGDRSALRAALASYLRRRPEGIAAVVEAATKSASEGNEDAMTDLLRGLPFDLPEAAEVTGLIGEQIAGARTFEARYHLLRLAAQLPEASRAAVADAVFAVARTAAEPELRTEATRTLGAVGGPDADLAVLLEDPWPGVREAAAHAAAQRGIEREILALARRYVTETWPRVRAALAQGMLSGPWPGDDAVRRLLEDPSELVRRQVVEDLDVFGDDGAQTILAEAAEARTQPYSLRRAAVTALARRCSVRLKPTLIAVIEASVQPDARPPDQMLALDAIALIGAAGFPGARRLLEEIVREAPGAAILAAALSALGALGDAEARPLVEEYRNHRDAGVQNAALSTLRALDRPRPTPPPCARESR